MEGAARARVCIITPGAIGSNPRVVKEADALHEAGFQVSVIATRTLDLTEPRDEALIQRIRWRLQRIDLRSRFGWRLRRLSQFAAFGAYSATRVGPIGEWALSPFTAALSTATRKIAADLYVAHYPSALPAAAAAARRHGALYAYDAEDYHLGDWPEDASYNHERHLVGAVEKSYLPGCAYVTAASPGIADALASTYRIECPRVLLNVSPMRQAPSGPTPRGVATPGPSVYWFSQTIGPNRGLECAVRAIAIAATRPHLYLRGTPVAGYAEKLQSLATRDGVADRLHYFPCAAPDDMERLASAYDLGLVSETGHTLARKVCLTNKLFSYLLAGIPPLMSATPAHQSFALEAGLTDFVFPVDDSTALASLIDRLLGEPQRLARARALVRLLASERYNWERESVLLIELARKQSMRLLSEREPA